MSSESPEITGIRYRSAADCAMRKEKDVNCVARRRNKPGLLLLLVIQPQKDALFTARALACA